MERCQDSFVSQLSCAYRTVADGMPTGLSAPSWIAFVVPLDDSVREIVEETIRVEWVEKGEEGADILIEPVG